MKTLDWEPKENAPRALLIGHDPRLQNSDTQAEYVLFANYFFDKTIKDRSFKSKYGLAASSFNQITNITSGKIKPEEVYITNLCNSALPHAPKGKTVYLPEDKAIEGFENIKRIITENPGIEYIFPMSLQVNYWLQKLGLYDSNDDFVEKSTPKTNGILNEPPYYEPKEKSTFQMICGNNYHVSEGAQTVIPILHAKCFPLNKQFRAYKPAYERIRNYFKN
ncbi:MAG: hypothetical protein EA412_00390 [Chitinophagaceae bacterium]|nr:MAG: hypothetical protein EA412_00390 [Chitinophagaceae bacterium]